MSQPQNPTRPADLAQVAQGLVVAAVDAILTRRTIRLTDLQEKLARIAAASEVRSAVDSLCRAGRATVVPMALPPRGKEPGLFFDVRISSGAGQRAPGEPVTADLAAVLAWVVGALVTGRWPGTVPATLGDWLLAVHKKPICLSALGPPLAHLWTASEIRTALVALAGAEDLRFQPLPGDIEVRSA